MTVVDLDRHATERTGSLVKGIPDDRWSAPTPCPEWTVQDLVRHRVAGNVKYTGIARGRDFWPGVPEVDLGDDPAATYRLTAEEMLEA